MSPVRLTVFSYTYCTPLGICVHSPAQFSDKPETMSSTNTQNRWLLLIGVAWMCAVATGLGLLTDYSAQPGEIGESPKTWPTESPISRNKDGFTVLIAVHPRCPCTRATVDELEGVLAKSETAPRTIALIFEPLDEDSIDTNEEFSRTSISAKLSKLPGVELIADPGSLIAQSFGAMTSGHTLVYSPDGSLVYSGGLTPTRAHTGPNTGSSTLTSLFNGDQPIAQLAPVYGCPLCPNASDTACFTKKDSTP